MLPVFVSYAFPIVFEKSLRKLNERGRKVIGFPKKEARSGKEKSSEEEIRNQEFKEMLLNGKCV